MSDTYYFLHLLDRPDAPLAQAPNELANDSPIEEPFAVTDWDPPQLIMVGGDPQDYLANDLGLRLCSSRMREVVESGVGEESPIQWLPVKVKDGAGANHVYWALRVVHMPDVLDSKRSIVVRGTFVVKPVLARERSAGKQIISFPGATTRLIVSGELRDSLLESCTGVDFSPVPVA